MRRGLTVVVLLAYLATGARLWAPIAHYQLFKGYYLERCENLARPEMQCNGKCVLAKRMQAQLAEAQTQADSQPVLPMSDITPHVLESTVVVCVTTKDAMPQAVPYRAYSLAPALGTTTPPPQV